MKKAMTSFAPLPILVFSHGHGADHRWAAGDLECLPGAREMG